MTQTLNQFRRELGLSMRAASFDRWLWRSDKAAPAHPQSRIEPGVDGVLRMRDTGGDKPALVFFCDPPVMVEHYDALISEIGADYRVIVIELPGFGFSRVERGAALGFAAAVASIEAAMHRLGPGPVVLCGPCICGFVVLELARRARLDIQGLVLMQTPDVAGMQAWTERMDPQRRLRKPFLGQLLVRAMAHRLASFWFRFATARQTDDAAMAQTSRKALAGGGAYPLATMLQTWGKGLQDHRIELPALVFWGRQDRSHAETEHASTLKLLPRAELIEFEHCGHFPELEDPEAFVARARPFFQACLDDYGAGPA